MDKEIYVDMNVLPYWDKEWVLKLGLKNSDFLLFYGHKITDTLTEACLSQWYPCCFEVDGDIYTSAEQYMMAEKAKLFGDIETREAILNTSDPRKCKSLGRKVKNFDKAVWDKNKRRIVERGNTEKFMQNDDLREYLLSTGNKVLVEASPTDRVWGIGLCKNNPDALDPTEWRGENLLGFALMNTRDWIAFIDSCGEFDEEAENISDEGKI